MATEDCSVNNLSVVTVQSQDLRGAMIQIDKNPYLKSQNILHNEKAWIHSNECLLSQLSQASTAIFFYPKWQIFRERVYHGKAGYCINTGAITLFCTVLVVIMFLILPNNLTFIGFVQVQSKCLFNSVVIHDSYLTL
ncbi:hypothetical protein BDR04DRAFT_1123196 [Suillus decipiens]|nr:hypothetical protein BDR04DRAFT_1123196 [Suillus decipiens]